MGEPRSRKMTKEQRTFYKAELERAEKFMVEHLTLKGKPEYIADGKNDLYVNLKWAALVKFLVQYSSNRITELYAEKAADAH